MNVHQIVEAVLFASDAPLTASEIARADESLDEDQVEAALQMLRAEYDDAGRAFQIVELAEGHQILTRAEFAPYLERFDNVPRPSRLSGPALETLAIIAYRQPIGRLEMEYIRGVGVSGVIRTLQERNLIENPDLAAYYERLLTVVSGPLWRAERLRAIWELNTGRCDELIESYVERARGKRRR